MLVFFSSKMKGSRYYNTVSLVTLMNNIFVCELLRYVIWHELLSVYYLDYWITARCREKNNRRRNSCRRRIASVGSKFTYIPSPDRSQAL